MNIQVSGPPDSWIEIDKAITISANVLHPFLGRQINVWSHQYHSVLFEEATALLDLDYRAVPCG